MLIPSCPSVTLYFNNAFFEIKEVNGSWRSVLSLLKDVSCMYKFSSPALLSLVKCIYTIYYRWSAGCNEKETVLITDTASNLLDKQTKIPQMLVINHKLLLGLFIWVSFPTGPAHFLFVPFPLLTDRSPLHHFVEILSVEFKCLLLHSLYMNSGILRFSHCSVKSWWEMKEQQKQIFHVSLLLQFFFRSEV